MTDPTTTDDAPTTEPEQVAASEAEVLPIRPPLALAARPPAEREVLMPLDAHQVVEGMRIYQQLLRDLLEASDWQTHDKHGNPLDRPFLKKSGWRKIARAFNLSFERVASEVERDEDGRPQRAEVWIRAVAPNGQFGDGDGYCSIDEGRFSSARGKAKLENDLRATATTRAKNRAISDLVGMGEVSAEEIDGSQASGLDLGGQASKELARLATAALTRLTGGNQGARRVGERIVADCGHLPVAVGRALIYVDGERARSQPASTDSGAPAGQIVGGERTVARQLADLEEARERVHGIARRARFSDETVGGLCALLWEQASTDELDGSQLSELAATLDAAGECCDEQILSGALGRSLAHPDRGEARCAFRRWLAERAQGRKAA